MSTYPVLNDRPIDQWTVTELKDELERRKLAVSGLKDDILKRLLEHMQDEMLDGGGKATAVTSPPEEPKVGGTPGSIDASVNQASIELHVDEDAEVTKQETDVISVTEAYDEITFATSEVTQEDVVGTAEASQKSLDAVAEVESSLVDTAATDETNGIGLDSASSGNTMVKEVNQYSEGHGDTIEKTPEDDTNKKMDVDDEPSDLTGGDVKLGLDVNSKILKLDDESAPPDDMKLHSDHEDFDAVTVAEREDDTSTIEKTPEDDTSKKMVVDDEPSDLAGGDIKLGLDVHREDEPTSPDDMKLHSDHEDSDAVVVAEREDDTSTIEKTPEDDTNKKMAVDDEPSDLAGGDIKLGLDVHNKILKLEGESAPPEDIKLHSDHEDSDAVAVAEREDGTSAIEKTSEDDSNKKMAVDDEPSDLAGDDIKLGLDVHSKILKLEDEPATPDAMKLHSDHEDSDAVAVAEPEDDTSKKMIIGDVPSGLTHTDVELGAKLDCKSEQEEVLTLSDATALHAYSKEHIVAAAKGIVLPMRTLMPGYTSNIDLDRKEESPDRNSHEKLNLDRSSGDESMDEDVMESKHADSDIKPDDLRGKTEVTSEHALKEISLLDTHDEGSSAHSKEVVAEEKLPTPAEKRKPEECKVIENNEPIKRKCLWNVDAVNIYDRASKLTSSGTQKEAICPAPERSVGRPNTIARKNSPKERIVPPPKTSATTSLRIDRFVRPFTLKAVQELLGKTGSVCSFWMDQIKTHCYVTYSSVEEAVATRNAVYNLQWPPNNHNYLIAEFVDPEEVKLKLETPPPSQVPISPSTATAPQAATFQQPVANQTLVPPHAPAASRGLLPTPAPFAKLPPTSEPGPARENLPPPPPLEPARALYDLFKKTQPGPARENLPPPPPLEPARALDDLFKKTKAYPRIYYMPLSEEGVSAKRAARAARDNGKRG